MAEVIHLKVRLEAIGCLCKRMERNAGVINENIYFRVVALWKWKDL